MRIVEERFDLALEVASVSGIDFRRDFERHSHSLGNLDRAIHPFFRRGAPQKRQIATRLRVKPK